MEILDLVALNDGCYCMGAFMAPKWLLSLLLDKGLTELNGTVGPWQRYALY